MTDRPELAARLEDLEATVDQLQEENAALNERVDELEAETDQLESR